MSDCDWWDGDGVGGGGTETLQDGGNHGSLRQFENHCVKALYKFAEYANVNITTTKQKKKKKTDGTLYCQCIFHVKVSKK